ncbi:Uncharacterised protein [Escherichia coli]|jgi:hypothetical protein|nr:hypothetical protein BvCmsG22A_03133 [Escherichia coli]CTZ88475.1 Uncharacterised protein [Escherichia coli]
MKDCLTNLMFSKCVNHYEAESASPPLYVRRAWHARFVCAPVQGFIL